MGGRGDNKICDNQPQRRRRRRGCRQSVMTLSRTSFQATSVTLRAHLFPHLVFPLFSFPRLHFVFLFLSFLSRLYLDFYIYLYLSSHLHPFLSLSLVLLSSLVLHLPSLSLCRTESCATLTLVISSTSFSCSHQYVLRNRKLFSFHILPARQQFLSTVETRDCNSVLCGHPNNTNVQ